MVGSRPVSLCLATAVSCDKGLCHVCNTAGRCDDPMNFHFAGTSPQPRNPAAAAQHVARTNFASSASSSSRDSYAGTDKCPKPPNETKYPEVRFDMTTWIYAKPRLSGWGTPDPTQLAQRVPEPYQTCLVEAKGYGSQRSRTGAGRPATACGGPGGTSEGLGCPTGTQVRRCRTPPEINVARYQVRSCATTKRTPVPAPSTRAHVPAQTRQPRHRAATASSLSRRGSPSYPRMQG